APGFPPHTGCTNERYSRAAVRSRTKISGKRAGFPIAYRRALAIRNDLQLEFGGADHDYSIECGAELVTSSADNQPDAHSEHSEHSRRIPERHREAHLYLEWRLLLQWLHPGNGFFDQQCHPAADAAEFVQQQGVRGCERQNRPGESRTRNRWYAGPPVDRRSSTCESRCE